MPNLLKRIYLEDPARKKAAGLYNAYNPEFKAKQIHQKVEIAKIDILDTRKIQDGAGKSYEAVSVEAEGNLIRTGAVKDFEFCEPAKVRYLRQSRRLEDVSRSKRLVIA